MDATERFVNACRRLPVDRPPVWIMRQAGRYMSSYQALRRQHSFMELCRNPELACEVALMPIEQLGVDAAILFSDILVPLEPMGVEVALVEARGPVITPPVRDVAAIDRLRSAGVADDLGYVYEAIGRIKRALPDKLPLLGFAGAPFTMACYLIEGGTSKDHHQIKRLLYAEPKVLHEVLDKIADVTGAYLVRQLEAGVDAVQIFDTWGGILDAEQWRQFSLPYTTRVMCDVRVRSDAPLIHYVRGGAHLLPALKELPCDVLSVDWRQPLSEVRAATDGLFALQGNLDPAILKAPASVIREGVKRTLDGYGHGPGHIFNLGHGITKDVTVEAARAVVDAVKELGPAYGGEVGSS